MRENPHIQFAAPNAQQVIKKKKSTTSGRKPHIKLHVSWQDMSNQQLQEGLADTEVAVHFFPCATSIGSDRIYCTR